MSVLKLVCGDFKASTESELRQVTICTCVSVINCSIFGTNSMKKCGFSSETAKALYKVLVPHTHASSTYIFACKLFLLFFFWVWAFNICRLANLSYTIFDYQMFYVPQMHSVLMIVIPQFHVLIGFLRNNFETAFKTQSVNYCLHFNRIFYCFHF